MADEVAKRDNNRVTTLLGVGNDASAEVLRLLLDPTTKRLLMDALAKIDGYESVGSDNATVASAGTAIQLGNHTCKRAIVHAASGAIVVGDSSAKYAEATRKGVLLVKTNREVFYVTNTNLLYVDAASSGTLVSYYWEN